MMISSQQTKPDPYELMAADILKRKQLGVERYGKPLEPFSGKDMIQEAFEEILDAMVYIKMALIEREIKK